MNPMWIEVPWLAGLTGYVIAIEWRLRKTINPARQLIKEETKRKMAHTKAFENLTDPEQLDEDFERSAIAMEAHTANRITEPREGAGPHAVVHRPRKMRPKLPTRWNPPADYNARLRGQIPPSWP